MITDEKANRIKEIFAPPEDQSDIEASQIFSNAPSMQALYQSSFRAPKTSIEPMPFPTPLMMHIV